MAKATGFSANSVNAAIAANAPRLKGRQQRVSSTDTSAYRVPRTRWMLRKFV